jgi:cardiolipin synthase
MTIPNIVTLGRMALTVVFGVLWWRGLHGIALGVFAVASLSDWLDGFLARTLDQKSRLGQILDPAADKLLVLVCFVVAAALHGIPIWLACLVIGRDVVLASGGALFALVLRGRFPSARWKPTRIGKYATFSQILTIACVLCGDVIRIPAFADWAASFAVVCAILTAASGTQYLAYGVKALVSGTVPEGGTAKA